MLYYADREHQPGMTRKEAEVCLVTHLQEEYPGVPRTRCLGLLTSRQQDFCDNQGPISSPVLQLPGASAFG